MPLLHPELQPLQLSTELTQRAKNKGFAWQKRNAVKNPSQPTLILSAKKDSELSFTVVTQIMRQPMNGFRF
mgnify:FL=1